MPSTGPLRLLSILVIAAGAALIVAGVVTWFVVRDQLAAENIVVSDDAPFLSGQDVNGPFSAYAEAEAINDHALEASGGLTYAELDRDDPTRDTVMTASFLRASLFTSVVSFGVAFFAFGVGIILILVGWSLLRIDRVLRATRVAQLDTLTPANRLRKVRAGSTWTEQSCRPDGASIEGADVSQCPRRRSGRCPSARLVAASRSQRLR